MRLSDDRILSIAQKIAFKLVRKRCISTRENLRQVAAWIEMPILEELAMEDEINEEVREFFAKMKTCPPIGSQEYSAMFQKKKEEVARKRNYKL
jgi:hypothetical protein